MSRKHLKGLLKSLAGDADIEFVIPHPLLPPRYQQISRGHNMILYLDRNFLIQIRWQSARSGKRVILSAGEVRRLVKYVSQAAMRYRADLKTFSRFLDRVAEKPPTDDTEQTLVAEQASRRPEE